MILIYYLAGLDRLIKERLRIKYYSRYMDDGIILHNDRDYLGFHFYLTKTGKVIRRLRTSNKRRMKRKLKRFRHAYREGKITQEAVHRSLVSYQGHLSYGHTYRLRNTIKRYLVLTKTKEENEHGEERK